MFWVLLSMERIGCKLPAAGDFSQKGASYLQLELPLASARISLEG
jgi:hypothetical protein